MGLQGMRKIMSAHFSFISFFLSLPFPVAHTQIGHAHSLSSISFLTAAFKKLLF